MIEGIIILAVAATVIVVALFGTTIISGITSIGASLSAVIGGVITGGATLLTAWIDWATASYAFTNYIGIAWVTLWGALFGYSAFKIATSDQKKWMNLVGRGSNYLGIALVLFLVAQPIIVSAGATYLADTTAYSEIDYNVTEAVTGSGYTTIGTRIYNATGYYIDTATVTHDNTTKETIATSIECAEVDGTYTTSSRMYGYLNTTFLAAESVVTKVVITYLYVGVGNISSMQISAVTPYKMFLETTDTADTVGGQSNVTYTWLPEPYQGQQLRATTQLAWQLYWDINNMVDDGDYFSISFKFYTTDTVLNSETIMFWLAVLMCTFDLVAILYATGAGPKYIW